MAVRLNDVMNEVHMCLAPNGIEINNADIDSALTELLLGCVLCRKYTIVMFPDLNMCLSEFHKLTVLFNKFCISDCSL